MRPRRLGCVRDAVGYGFNSNGRYGQGGLIGERFRDRILEAPPESLLDENADDHDPHKIWAAMMRGYLDRGYNVVKMKIGGAPIDKDRRRIEAGLAEIGSNAQLAVDANGRFDLETGIAYAKMLRDYPLFWYEEAGDPLDYALQAALSEFYPAFQPYGGVPDSVRVEGGHIVMPDLPGIGFEGKSDLARAGPMIGCLRRRKRGLHSFPPRSWRSRNHAPILASVAPPNRVRATSAAATLTWCLGPRKLLAIVERK